MAATIPDAHFHYLTVPPEFLSRKYLDFLREYYPAGSLDTLPMDFGNAKSLFRGRRFLLDRFIQTFPGRKLILIGDNSNVFVTRNSQSPRPVRLIYHRDILTLYPKVLRDNNTSGQVQCILIRNVSLTDKTYWYKNLPTQFKGLNESKFMFFKEPDDLKGIDFANGGCVNHTIRTDLTESGNFVSEGFRVLIWTLLCHWTHAQLFDCPGK